jgi:hypothetical protein
MPSAIFITLHLLRKLISEAEFETLNTADELRVVIRTQYSTNCNQFIQTFNYFDTFKHGIDKI